MKFAVISVFGHTLDTAEVEAADELEAHEKAEEAFPLRNGSYVVFPTAQVPELQDKLSGDKERAGRMEGVNLIGDAQALLLDKDEKATEWPELHNIIKRLISYIERRK